MEHVAFFRNVNQGQRGHPSTDDLLGAVADAGFADAVAFQSNGTVVFADAAPGGAGMRERAPHDERAVPETADGGDAPDGRDAPDLHDALVARTGIERDVFVMSLEEIVGIVDAHALTDDVGRRELTVHRGGVIDVGDPSVVREAARRRCRLIAAGAGWTLATNERDRESNATPVVERLTGGPATSRGLTTLVRLVDRFAP